MSGSSDAIFSRIITFRKIAFISLQLIDSDALNMGTKTMPMFKMPQQVSRLFDLKSLGKVL